MLTTTISYIIRSAIRNFRADFNRYKIVFSNPSIYICNTVKITLDQNALINVASGVYIGDYSVINIEADARSSSIILCGVIIGESTYIGPLNNIRAGGGIIKIGKNCLISQMVTIVASNHGTNKNYPISKQPWRSDRINVQIGDDVWIGAGSTILPGITIGDGAIIGANSVVNKSIGKMEIFAGSPAKKIGDRS